MGWDSATFWDRGTKVSSLSLNKGTPGQAQNLAMGRDSQDSLSKSRMGRNAERDVSDGPDFDWQSDNLPYFRK